MTSKLGTVFDYCGRISKVFTEGKSFPHSDKKGAEFDAFLFTLCIAIDILHKRGKLNDVPSELLNSEFDISIRQHSFLNCVEDPQSFFDDRRQYFWSDISSYLENPKKIPKHIIHALYHKPLANNIHYSNFLNDIGPMEFNKVREDIKDFVKTFEATYKAIESYLNKIITN